MKIIIFIIIVVGVWISIPLWRPQPSSTLSSSIVRDSVSSVPTKRHEYETDDEIEIITVRDKFGKKSAVMHTLRNYWNYTYSAKDNFEFLRCTRAEEGENGWEITCSYRINSGITQDEYIVNKGVVTKR